MNQSDPINLLLIEDDDADAIALNRAFSKSAVNCNIHRACDGVEALEMLESNKLSSPFFIVTDLSMPGMNGVELLDELRKNESLRRNIVFVLTASNSQLDIKNCYKHNIAGYFVKDDNRTKLSQFVNFIKNYWNTTSLPNSYA